MKTLMQILSLIITLATYSNAANTVNADSVKFIGNELLGRPTNNSININLCAEKDIDAYIEYGLTKSSYSQKTTMQQVQASVPYNFILSNLLPGATYYYRVQYRLKGTQDFIAKTEHSFATQRLKGKSFSFAIQADPHLDNNTDPELYKRTLRNIIEGGNDFLIDLGDNFMSEKESNKSRETTLQRHLIMRTFYDVACHTVPLLLVLGNHEGEQGSELNGTENNLAVWATQIRKQYYPNPIPNGFYTGGTKSELFVGVRESYYAYEWGDALFVVIDPYWNTLTKQGDNWRFSLGKEQYDWFQNVLESSKAKFKFVFGHQIVGGKDNQGRGGSDYAQFYEMGGQNGDGSWGFDTQRKGWGIPIHQLMVKNHVNVFFHGHDHFYVNQQKDGVIYQLVPQPGYPGNKSTDNAAEYGYLTGTMLGSSGYLKVTVTDSTSKVDYVKSYLPAMETGIKRNGTIESTYIIRATGNTASMHESKSVPVEIKLSQNYPNPFNPDTVINFQIPEASQVSLKVYDALGKEITALVNDYISPGNYSVNFSAFSYHISSGVYFSRLTVGSNSKTIKMILTK